ncbi:O-antigen ligase family protein [bacterium]|nr:O-antigen ligase family protein [bacterium]
MAILLTGSRGGVIGAVIAVFLYYWRARRHIRRHAVITSLLIAGVLVFSMWQIAPRPFLDRFDIQQILERGGLGRFFVWRVGVEAFFHRPLNGYGYNNFPYVYELFSVVVPADYLAYWTYRVAHSIYLQAFAELGIIGGLLLLFTLWKHWRLARTLARKSLLGVALESALVGILVSSATLGTLNYKYFWLGLTLILLLKNTMRRHRGHIQHNENS